VVSGNLRNPPKTAPDWSASWLLNLNFEKSKVMHIGNTPHSDYYVTVSGNATNLSDITFEKDLGVWITDKLESGLHCQKAVASANKILGMIRRAFYNLSGNLFVFLYKTCEAALGILCSVVVSLFS